MAAIALTCMSFACVSCDDFLTLTPPNEIVLENFWNSEEDVQQVVASCYSTMASTDFVKRALFWGEVRSEDFIAGNSPGTEDTEILEGNIMPKHSITNWAIFYNVINLCNTVMYYGPGVVGKDPDFSQSKMDSYDAEVRTLRALCYFYLVRTFKNVPLILDPTISDDNDFMVPAASSDSILNQIVVDLLHAEKYAKKEYSKETYNKGRITIDAIHAILADVYMWKQDYTNCVKYCDLVITAKQEAAKANAKKGTNEDLSNTEFPLIGSDLKNSSDPYIAYNEIFGDGNSFESIFELQFTPDVQTNSVVSDYYGNNGTNVGVFAASKVIGENATAASGNDVFKKTDVRTFEFINEASNVYRITKYAASSINTNKTPRYRDTNYANWIFYRLTDIMLLKAEALTQLAPQKVTQDTTTTTVDNSEMLKEAFKLTTAVYYRSQTGLTKSDSLQYADYASSKKMFDLVLLERHRELMFEGKRWFDLVRMALREGSNTNMLNLCTRKYSDNIKTVKSKMSTQNALFFPIYQDELKVNTLLEQNPAYINQTTVTTN